MTNPSILVVYHPGCKASTDFLIKVSKLTWADLQYINIRDEEIDSKINIDVVPFMLIDNDEDKIFKGKEAYDKVDELLSQNKFSNTENKSFNWYNRSKHTFVPNKQLLDRAKNNSDN